jgi:hypothetical protein
VLVRSSLPATRFADRNHQSGTLIISRAHSHQAARSAADTVWPAAGEAAAPLLFGYVSQYVFRGSGSAQGGAPGEASTANSAGLEYTFLLFLGTLLVAGLLSLAGLRTYPRDVATAAASAKAIGQTAGSSKEGRAAA